MARVAPVLVALAFAGALLAGCADSSSTDVFVERFGKENVMAREGYRLVRGPLIEGDFGNGWGHEPNATIEAPRIDQSSKTPQTPGGGTRIQLPAPEVETPLKLRFASGYDVSGMTVRWGMADNSSAYEWSEPMPAGEVATLSVQRVGLFKIVAELTDASGQTAKTEPIQAMLHVRWTIDSVVWPFAPNAPSGCQGQGPAFVCYGRWTMACAWADQASACAYAGTYGAGIFACAAGVCAPVPGVGVPVELPEVSRPPNYAEMADEYVFDVPVRSHVTVETRYRSGEWQPPHGHDVDLEVALDGQEGQCSGWGGYDSVVPVSAEHSHESFADYIASGTWTARVGGVSCPWFSYNNLGAVPYTVSVFLEYGKTPPPCGEGGGGGHSTATATASATMDVAGAEAAPAEDQKEIPLMGPGCPGPMIRDHEK